MNIFYLDSSPALAAADHADKHAVKMIIEYAQLLSTAQWFAHANALGLLPWSKPIGKLWLHIAEFDFESTGAAYDDVLDMYLAGRVVEHITGGRKFPRRIRRIDVLRSYLKVVRPDSLYAKCYSPTHVNHPSAVWARDSVANYEWLCELATELCYEYTRRYGRTHKTQAVIAWLASNTPSLGSTPFVQPPQCMPDDVKVPGDSIAAYRNYYNRHKAYMATWRYSSVPKWYTPNPI